MFKILPETNINFIGARRAAFGLSIAMVALGIFAAIMIASGKGEIGIDFAGGAMVQGHFAQPVATDALRGSLNNAYPDAMVTELTDFQHPNAFIVKVKGPKNDQEAKEQVTRIKELVTTQFPGNEFTVDSEHAIGPAVGESLRKDAQWAVLLSLVGILVYIWFRFDFRSGVAATVATFHDVLAVLGITFLMGIEFDLLLITALLTLAGYSLTDTVIVYDRIRENLRKFRSKAEFVNAVNLSINEVLARTLNTSLTVLLVVGTLLLFGGDVLRGFAIAMIFGVVIGTYSSWFVASSLIVEWEARRPSRFK
jgi:preprotein translocase subunit SecF